MSLPLWITYAWTDNAEGDFDYLIQQLNAAAIPALYDKIALIPGRKLWDQIAKKITEEPLSGWAYLISPVSLNSQACKEELSYALQRALETKGAEFPLIGLLHQVSIKDVPLPLRVRLCINLANPDWIEEVRATVEGRAPQTIPQPQSSIIVKMHRPYLGDNSSTAIEFRPRFGEITYWRIGYPSKGPLPTRWGPGPANGGGISGMMHNVMEFTGMTNGIEMKFIGVGNTLTASTSGYVVFKGALPERLFFGVSREPFGTDMSGQLYEIK